jgi:serine protease
MRRIIFMQRAALVRFCAAAIAAATMLPGAGGAAEYNPALTRPRAEQQDTVERVIVKLRPASRAQAQAATGGEAAAAAVDVARIESLARRMRVTVNASRALGGGMHALNVSAQAGGETAAQTLARLQADSDVEYVVPDRRVYPHAVPTDPRFPGQWYLAAAQLSATRAQAAWDITVGRRGVVVAVLDTGVLFDHPDLGRMTTGGRFLPGYDFVSPNSTLDFTRANDGDGRDASPADPGDSCDGSGSSWHGTRVAGIISALSDNGVGVTGVMWNSTILPVRVLGKCDGLNSDVLAGMRWAAGLSVPGVPLNPNPARIINLSLGSEGVGCDIASRDAVRDVTATGALVVVSAGNEGGPVDSPANCAGAMAVLGLRHAGTKVGFSSLGPEIALGAPGGNCVNTTQGAPCLFSIDTTSNLGSTIPGFHTYTDQINYNVGTSFSAPIVSGIAGLMLSVNGNLKSAQLISRMKASALPYPTSSETATAMCRVPLSSTDLQAAECICTTAACGAGMANASGAVNEALRPIAAILAPATYAANSSVALQAGGSAGACGRTVASYAWSVLSGPGTLTSNATAATSIQAPASGTTVIQLVVTDDAGRTDTATITLAATASSTTAPADAGSTACISDEPVALVVASDASASEAGPEVGAFTLTRTGSTASALTVNVAYSGSAANGVDYVALPASFQIPAGERSIVVAVTPIDDAIKESAETVVLTMQAGTGYEVSSPASATVTITDNDSASSGKGGGGAFDLATLIVGLVAVARLAIRRRRCLPSAR